MIATIKNNLLNRTGSKNAVTSVSGADEISSESSSSTGSTSSVAMSASIPIDCSRARQVVSPAPLSPGSVIDPFSLELSYARQQQQAIINQQEALYQQQIPVDSTSNGSISGRKSRFRGRTGSIGAAANAVIDMFRNRSNSIAVDTTEYRPHRKVSCHVHCFRCLNLLFCVFFPLTLF